MRKISIRFEEGSVKKNGFIKKFFEGLGLDPQWWLEEQEVELPKRACFTMYQAEVPFPVELQHLQKWVCRLEERDNFLLLWVGDFLWAVQFLPSVDRSLRDLSPLIGFPAISILILSRCIDYGPLSGLTTLTSLDLSLSSIRDLGFLSGLLALKSLDLSFVDLPDLGPLRGLPALKSLILRGCCSLDRSPLSDLSLLNGLTTLTNLDLSCWNKLTDLGPLSGLASLTSLDLNQCGSLSDLSPLRGLASLTSLDLNTCGRLTDLTPLGGLQALTSLNLGYCGSLGDLSPVRGLASLTSLNLGYCGRLTDLTPLGGLQALTSLNLGHCGSLSDLDPLSGLKALSRLDLYANPSLIDLSPLSGLTALTSLNLSNCESLSDLSPLGGLTALTSLDLSNCKSLSDLSPLSGLHALTSLDLTENKTIRSLSPLANLPVLRSLKFDSLRVQSIEPLRGIISLRKIEEFNPSEVAELLAHAAFRRGDRLCIQNRGNSWLEEAKGWLDGPPDLQDRFAATLGECFSLLGECEVGRAYEEFLESRPDFSVAPWKAWLGGTLRESGFDLYRQRVERLPVPSMLAGAIGGACATLPYEEQAEWSRKWLQELKTARLSDAKSLLSVAPEICLAHARLGEKETLGLWLVQFTDPSDLTALDPVQAALAGFQLACGDIPAAENHAFAIQSPAVRDPVLGALVTALAAADLDRASAYLLLIVDQSRKSALAKQLAAEPGASEAVLYRLLVAVGNAGFDLAEWVSAIPDPAGKRLVREFSARTQGERRGILSRVAKDLRRCADEFLAEVSDDK